MKKSTDRRANVTSQMKKLGVDFEFIDGVDGRELSQSYVDSVFDKETAQKIWKPMTRGEIGCSLSHISIYKKMIAENIKFSIILEDDLKLSDDFVKVVNELINKVPSHIDIVKMYHNRAKFYWWQKSYNIIDEYRIEKMHTIVAGTVGYYITLSGAKKILAKNEPKIIRPIDDITGDILFGKHNLYCLTPKIISLTEVESTIRYKGQEDTNHNTIYLNIFARLMVVYLKIPAEWFRKWKRFKNWLAKNVF